VKSVLSAASLLVMPCDTHSVPLMVGDPRKCRAASDLLLSEQDIYIQRINFSTVAARDRAPANCADTVS
jgi:5-aminolevulinate synthase